MMRTIFRLSICALLLERVVCLSANFMETDALRIGASAATGKVGHLTVQQMKKSTDAMSFEHVFRFGEKLGHVSFPQLRKSILAKDSGNSTKSPIPASPTSFLISHAENISIPRIIVVVLITCVLLGVACVFMEEDDGTSEAIGDLVNKGPAKPREELYAMELCDGSWAVTYQKAEGQMKQGLELLFRCHIIPTQEFGHARVSQEHIDECVWIATHMLRQRSLEEWLNKWPEARDAFDDSVRKCLGGKMKGMATQVAKNMPKDDEKSDKLGKSSKGGSKAAPANKDAKGGMLKIGDKKSLMDRCRQIMAKSDAGRKLWSSMPAESSAPSAKASPPQVPGATTETSPGMASAASATPQEDAAKDR